MTCFKALKRWTCEEVDVPVCGVIRQGDSWAFANIWERRVATPNTVHHAMLRVCMVVYRCCEEEAPVEGETSTTSPVRLKHNKAAAYQTTRRGYWT